MVSSSESGRDGDGKDFELSQEDEPEGERRFSQGEFPAGGNLDGGSNRFFLPPDGERRGSGQVFAAVEVPEPDAEDSPEPSDDDKEPTLFECVDTAWTLNLAGGTDTWLDIFRTAPLSVLELTSYPMPPFPDEAEPGEIAWFEFGYDYSSRREANGRIYTSLFSQGDPVRVRHCESRGLDWADNGPLGRNGFLAGAIAGTLHSTRRTDPRAFQQSLRGLGKSFGVAAYDVGQGGCQALIHENGHQPLLYVDLGGGVLYNNVTFPRNHRGFCFSASRYILLTHWDWDHWSSAYRFRQALTQYWIAPPVPHKPIQQAFAADLYTREQLQIWDGTWPWTIQGGGVRIERCTGRTSNDSGLAVTLYSKRLRDRNCLLPGDADYRFIPSVAGAERFNALCMTHHGGRLHSAAYPVPKRNAVALISSGPRNTYKHPLFGTLVAHLKAGWPIPAQTGLSGQRPCHVLWPWGKQPHLFHGDCPRAACSTAVARTAPHTPGSRYPVDLT